MKKRNRKQDIESLKAFLPKEKEIPLMVEFCNLHPTTSWRKWTDNLGNYLVVGNNKQVYSNYSSKKEKVITDLYHKAPPKKISSISSWAFVSFGKHDTKEFSVAFIWLLGFDKKLRLLAISDNDWLENSPPLSCGVDTLRPVLRNIDVDDYQVADILNIKGPAPAVILKSWATQWPPSQEMKDEMLGFSQELGQKIIKDCQI